MMVSMEVYLRRGQRQLRQWKEVEGIQRTMKVLGYGAGGLLLSAAGLGGAPQPIAMGLCCAASGWRALVAGLGSMAGYRIFWSEAGLQGMVWSLLGTLLGLLLGKRTISREMPLLASALASFFVAASGLVFQILWLDETSFFVYGLRVLTAFLSPLLFARRVQRRDALSGWLCQGVLVLALARVGATPWLSLGYIACGWFAACQTFPGVVLAGMGMDLARITAIPMTAVLCIAYFLRLQTRKTSLLCYAVPAGAYLGVMVLWGSWDLHPVPGLLVGTILGQLLNPGGEHIRSPGHTGYAQVRLEQTAGILSQVQLLLLENGAPPVDEALLLEKVRLRACGACSARKVCREQQQLTIYHLRQPMEFVCRRPARIRGELRRGREQLAAMKRDRQRQQEYRWALVQQYRFLSEYVRDLADGLARREPRIQPVYRIRVSARSRKKKFSNGDRCLAFPGTQCRYYVVLCDGMGTGIGAAREGQAAVTALKQMLTGGMNAEHALRSVNSILVLRGLAGAVTLDLAEICLDSGKTVLYKWGASPSYLLRRRRVERIGQSTPPPGLSIVDSGASLCRLTLCRGDTLILLSDGVPPEVLDWESLSPDMETGELAQSLLQSPRGENADDATAAVIRLELLNAEQSVAAQ